MHAHSLFFTHLLRSEYYTLQITMSNKKIYQIALSFDSFQLNYKFLPKNCCETENEQQITQVNDEYRYKIVQFLLLF